MSSEATLIPYFMVSLCSPKIVPRFQKVWSITNAEHSRTADCADSTEREVGSEQFGRWNWIRKTSDDVFITFM